MIATAPRGRPVPPRHPPPPISPDDVPEDIPEEYPAEDPLDFTEPAEPEADEEDTPDSLGG